MVAGVKGVVFLDDDRVAVTSSTSGELLVISLKEKVVERVVALEDGVKAESLAKVSSEVLLVADGAGTLCRVELSTEPAGVSCVATADFRITSVAAYGMQTAFVAGAARGRKTECTVRRVDLETGTVSAPMLEAPMVRALCVDGSRLLAGAIDVDNDNAENASTRVVSWDASDDFQTTTLLATLDCFVHAIARHPRDEDTFVFLARHHASQTNFDCPVRVLRFHSPTTTKKGGHTRHAIRAAIAATFPIGHDLTIPQMTRHTVKAAMGVRAGREHAMAVSPDGAFILTGSVDNSTKGVLQLWDTTIINNNGTGGSSCCC